MVLPVRDEPSFFHWALLISLLLHVLLLLLIPEVHQLWSRLNLFHPSFVPAKPAEEKPLEFEFVDLADDREEKPANSARAALSDKDRRAHGGEGKKAATAASRGNSSQLVQAQGGQRFQRGSPPRPNGPPTRQVPPARERPPSEEKAVKPERPMEEGIGAESLTKEKLREEERRIQLPPAGSFTMPPDLGGISENPDRGGGMVDSGGLSFDTQWYDWGPYAKLMLAKIRRNWRIPEIAQLGVAGRVRIRFFIESDGSVTGLRITDESGKPPMDFAARDAIADSSPFNPLPPDLAGVTREGVTITFFYNSKPHRKGRQ